MKDNSPLFHATLLTLFLLAVGFAAFRSGTPRSGMLRPGVESPVPFVPQQKPSPVEAKVSPAQTLENQTTAPVGSEASPETPAVSQ